MKNVVFSDVMSCRSWKTDVLEESMASIIRMKRISELGTTLAVTSNWSTVVVMKNSLGCKLMLFGKCLVFQRNILFKSSVSKRSQARSSSFYFCEVYCIQWLRCGTFRLMSLFSFIPPPPKGIQVLTCLPYYALLSYQSHNLLPSPCSEMKTYQCLDITTVRGKDKMSC
jgi:hypothetical protein